MSNEALIENLRHSVYADGDKQKHEYVAESLLERFFIIERSETLDSDVVEQENRLTVTSGSGPEFAVASTTDNPNWLRNKALNLLRIADYVENREAILAARDAEAAEARDKRRDALAKELSDCSYDYWGAAPILRNAIDRIIDLESAA